MIAPNEMTLDELRAALAPLIPAHAAFDGWSDKALANAAAELAIPAGRARLAFPDGPVQMIDAWFDAIDLAMAKAWPLDRIAKLKIRERIRDLVLYRIEVINPHREALRRALAVLADPRNGLAGPRLAWRAADRMWRIAGDVATDFNHYSKRTILAGLYSATMLVYLDDDSDGLATTRGFLDRRIDDVMSFEKFKASWRGSRQRLPSLSRFLGRLRYPAV
ncbi:MAG TPA: COQ9 family protein [Allosphingosinicella sp.]|nr:COQ9 family protein [Allosphingosinicella sp.]